MVLANSDGVPRVPPYLGASKGRRIAFRLQGYHLLWRAFPDPSTMHPLCNSPRGLQLSQSRSRDPMTATPASLAPPWFGLFPVRSPLLGESRLLSIPGGTKMFQFPPFARLGYVFTQPYIGMTPCRFPNSEIPGSKPVWRLPEAYRSLPRLSSPSDAKASTVCP
jgi:hypothetical protein